MEASTDRGMEVAMITVDRQLPRNSRIITLVRAAAMTPSLITPETAALTKIDWSLSRSIFRFAGRESLIWGRRVLTPSTMARVEAEPFLLTLISTVRRPSLRTTLVWGEDPSRT